MATSLVQFVFAGSDNTFAPFDDVTAEALRFKHLSRTSLGSLPPTPNIACLFLQQIDIYLGGHQVLRAWIS